MHLADEEQLAFDSLDDEANIDHVIARAPNTQLSAGRCKLKLDADVPWDQPLVLLAKDVFEAAMQPFPSNSEIVSKHGAISSSHSHHQERDDDQLSVITSESRTGIMRRSGFFFRPGMTLQVSVYLDGDRENDSVKYAIEKLGNKVGDGELVLGDSVYVDSEGMNHDPFEQPEKITAWRHEFDQIGKSLD